MQLNLSRKMYRIKDLEQMYGVSRSTINRMIKRKALPKPISFTGVAGGAVGWTADMLCDHLPHHIVG